MHLDAHTLDALLEEERREWGLKRVPGGLKGRMTYLDADGATRGSVTALDLGNTYMGPRGVCCGLRMLQYMPLVESLNLHGTGLYAANVGQMMTHGSGDSCVTGNDCIDVLCTAAAGHPSLRHIDVRDNGLGTVAAKALLRLLEQNTRIVSLDVGGNNVLPREHAKLVRQLRSNVAQSGSRSPVRVPAAPLPSRPAPVATPQLSVFLADPIRAALAGGLQEVGTSVTAADCSQAFYVLSEGSVSLGIRQPGRGSAAADTQLDTWHAPCLLPYAELLGPEDDASDVDNNGVRRSEPADQWAGVCAEDVQLRSLVRERRGVRVALALVSPQAVLCRVVPGSAHEAELRRLLASRMSAMLPCVARVPCFQSLSWAALLLLCDSGDTVCCREGEAVGLAGCVGVVASGSVTSVASDAADGLAVERMMFDHVGLAEALQEDEPCVVTCTSDATVIRLNAVLTCRVLVEHGLKTTVLATSNV